MIPLPHPFLVIPTDGEPFGIEVNPEQRPPILGVSLVTPYIAQRWLHAGRAGYRPVVMHDADYMLAGRAFVRQVAEESWKAGEAAVVELGTSQGDSAWHAVVAMRDVWEEEESDDVPGVVLDAAGGRVIAGASGLYELRRPLVMVVLIIDEAKGTWN